MSSTGVCCTLYHLVDVKGGMVILMKDLRLGLFSVQLMVLSYTAGYVDE